MLLRRQYLASSQNQLPGGSPWGIFYFNQWRMKMAVQIPFKQIVDGGSVGDNVRVIMTNIAFLLSQMESVNSRLAIAPSSKETVKRTLTRNQLSLCDVHGQIADLAKSLK